MRVRGRSQRVEVHERAGARGESLVAAGAVGDGLPRSG
jgi:hypothetical protein